MALQFFGQRWDAPAFESAVEVPVPVGQTCLFCPEPIGSDDSGVVTPYIDERGKASASPIHIECHIRSIVGSVAHLEGRCSCVTGRGSDDHTNTSWRQQGRDTITWLQTHGDRS